MTDSQVDEIKAAKEKLMESAQKLFAKLYEAQQGAAGAGPDMGAGAGPDMNNGSASTVILMAMMSLTVTTKKCKIN